MASNTTGRREHLSILLAVKRKPSVAAMEIQNLIWLFTSYQRFLFNNGYNGNMGYALVLREAGAVGSNENKNKKI